MTPWVARPTIDIDLGVPLARRFDGIPPDAIAGGKRLLAAVMSEIPSQARMLADLVRVRTLGRFQHEAAAFARLVQVDWRDVVLANISYDLVLSRLGCSTLALSTPSGPVLARNMDWHPQEILAQTSYLHRYGKKGTLAFATAGWPGAIGVVSGMSGRGFAVALNAVSHPDGVDKLGYPVLLHLRRVIEDATDFDAALGMISQERLAAPGMFTLVGRENRERAVIERSCRKAALRWPRGDEPLMTTNHYRLMLQGEPESTGEFYASTCGRYDALCGYFATRSSELEASDDELLYALSDPEVIQEITAQHVIMRPRSLTMGLWAPQRLMQAV